MRHWMHLFLLATVFALSGCALGVTHVYDESLPAIRVNSPALVVGVLDQRTYVVDKSKPPSFVGLSRGGYGNPFDVNTSSGAPLATDMAKAIQSVLARNGTRVDVVTLTPDMRESEAIQKLAQSGRKGILIALVEWKSDTYMTVLLHYNVRASAIDPSGRVLGTARLSGTDSLGTNPIDPPGQSRTAVPQAFKQKMEQIFSSPEIAGAL